MKIKHIKGVEGQMPDKAHLILYTGNGLATAIPPGAGMGIVVRTNERDPLHKMALMEVTRDKIVFKCLCAPGCSKVYTFRKDAAGAHPHGVNIKD